jgi:hypothetical protein
MLFFRSEEEVAAWRQARNVLTGETMTLAQLWELAKRWYGNRLEASYHGRSLDKAQQIFRELGFTAPFWYLDG